MIHFDQATIITAIIGMIGLLSTALIVGTAFRRNKLGTQKWQ